MLRRSNALTSLHGHSLDVQPLRRRLELEHPTPWFVLNLRSSPIYRGSDACLHHVAFLSGARPTPHVLALSSRFFSFWFSSEFKPGGSPCFLGMAPSQESDLVTFSGLDEVYQVRAHVPSCVESRWLSVFALLLFTVCRPRLPQSVTHPGWLLSCGRPFF